MSEAQISFEKVEVTEGPIHVEENLSSLPPEHSQYLLHRHGTLDLSPLPTTNDADPYNWPNWKKNVNLVIVSFHAFMTTFTASSIIPAFDLLAQDLGVTIQDASYLVSLQILMLGIGPLMWKPFCRKYGRRPSWLLSTGLSLICNIGCAKGTSYGTMMICRILVAFFISPGGAFGSGVVSECFFAHERGQKMGIWAHVLSSYYVYPAIGPLTMGFVAQHLGWAWIYWIVTILNGAQFLAYFFLGPETIWKSPPNTALGASTSFQHTYLKFGVVSEAPIQLREFYEPLLLFKYATVALPAISYSNTFAFASILMTVEIPQTFGAKFGFNPQQLGLQFIGIIAGAIPGEFIGGTTSDLLQNRERKKRASAAAPEYRLWGSYFGFATVIIGLWVFTIQLQHATQGHWNITPLVGVAFAAFGNQIITTILVTYAVDTHPEQSDNIGVFVNLVRYGWGFICPFWFPSMLKSLTLIGSGGLMVGFLIAFSLCPIVWLQLRARRQDK
ncbi:putative MFS transporter [Xylogone sp. PMI_703]|nr:putative MFS transporter [Xylogone sp. PMI_703]